MAYTPHTRGYKRSLIQLQVEDTRRYSWITPRTHEGNFTPRLMNPSNGERERLFAFKKCSGTLLRRSYRWARPEHICQSGSSTFEWRPLVRILHKTVGYFGQLRGFPTYFPLFIGYRQRNHRRTLQGMISITRYSEMIQVISNPDTSATHCEAMTGAFARCFAA